MVIPAPEGLFTPVGMPGAAANEFLQFIKAPAMETAFWRCQSRCSVR
jgi:hypothetical protein